MDSKFLWRLTSATITLARNILKTQEYRLNILISENSLCGFIEQVPTSPSWNLLNPHTIQIFDCILACGWCGFKLKILLYVTYRMALKVCIYNFTFSGPWKTTKDIWPSYYMSGARLKNSNAEWRCSCTLALWICEASVASIHKLAKAWGCFEGSRQCILSHEKNTPSKIPVSTCS